MKSTGEVMGISDSFGSAFAKAQLAASNGLPLAGTILITVNDSDKPTVTPIARRFHEMGFTLLATRGHGAVPARARHPGELGVQGARGASELPRHDRERRRRAARQHAARQARAVGRLHAAPGGDPPAHRVHDDALGGERGVATPSCRCVAAVRRAVAAGVAAGHPRRRGSRRCERPRRTRSCTSRPTSTTARRSAPARRSGTSATCSAARSSASAARSGRTWS